MLASLACTLIPGVPLVVSPVHQYADDTTLILSTDDAIKAVFDIYSLFEKASGSRLNQSKSFYDLRGNNILSLCKPRTTSFGLSSFSYFSAKKWNALPDCIRTSDFTEFKRNIQGMTFV